MTGGDLGVVSTTESRARRSAPLSSTAPIYDWRRRRCLPIDAGRRSAMMIHRLCCRAAFREPSGADAARATPSSDATVAGAAIERTSERSTASIYVNDREWRMKRTATLLDRVPRQCGIRAAPLSPLVRGGECGRALTFVGDRGPAVATSGSRPASAAYPHYAGAPVRWLTRRTRRDAATGRRRSPPGV